MIDLDSAKIVEIVVDSTGKLWVNVDGKCQLRIGSCETVTVDDPARGRDVVKEVESIEQFEQRMKAYYYNEDVPKHVEIEVVSNENKNTSKPKAYLDDGVICVDPGFPENERWMAACELINELIVEKLDKKEDKDFQWTAALG